MKVDAAALERLPADERKVAERLLDELKGLRETNPLQFVSLYPKQQRFVEATEFRKAFFGGNGAGKTHVGVIDDLVQLCDADALPAHLRELKRWDPPFYLRVVVPKMANIDGVLLEKFRELCPKGQLVGDSFDKAYDKVNRKLRFKNGSSVLFNTSDQDRDAHAGVRLHRVHFDEEPEGEHGRGIYVENVMRLRDFVPHAQVMFTMTPLFGMSWTFDEIYERRGEPGVFCIVASMLDNEFINAEEQARQVAHLPVRERQAIIEGQFVNFHGHVLENFEECVHVVDPPTREHVQDLEVLVGYDPGISRGGVVWVGFDRDNHAVVFDELYPSDLDVPQIVGLIREKNAAWGIDPQGYVIDPTARNRSLTNAESVTSLLMQEGIFPVPGQNDRQAGILQLRARLEQKALLISRDCVNLRFEINRYLVAEDEESGKGAAAGFKTKGPDHLVDPLRYVCMERLWTRSSMPEARLNPLGLPVRPPVGVVGPWVPPEPESGPMGRFS